MKNNRHNEYMDENAVVIDEYTEGKAYSVRESEEEYKQRKDAERKNFSTGAPLSFDCKDAVLQFPVLLTEKGQKVTEKDEYGNEIYVRDEDKEPNIRLTRRGIGKKALCIVPVSLFVEMLENLQSTLYTTDKAKAEKVRDVLDTVFPYDIINYGTFTENGERHVQADKFSYVQNAGLRFRSFPVLDEEGKPATYNYIWVDDKGQHEITLCYYHKDPIKGAQLGIK